MKRLLLVDDDALVLRAYRDRLSAHGFHVNTAANGAAAIAMLRSARPELVVLDLMMPDVSGVEVLKFIRSEKRLAATPVVVLTNAYLNDLGRKAAAIGIERALLKAQCSPSVLMSVIDEILESSKAPGEPSESPGDSTIAPGPGVAEPPAPRAIAPETGQTSGDQLDHESRAEAGAHLLAHSPTICADLRKLFQALGRPAQTSQQQVQQLQDLYRRVHFLAGTAGLADFWQITQITTVFEALLYVLMDNPARLGPSVQHTIANLVDFLELLFHQARDARLAQPRAARLLVVDDDPLSNRLVLSALRQAQLQARSTEDPLVAWQWIQQEQFDLVLLDIEMPGLSGFELCKRLRTLPDYKKTPVVYVTSHTDFQSRAQSTLSGGNDLISKPVLPMELAAKAVMHLLKGQMAG